MARTEKRTTGDLGEDLARRYLEDRGFVVVERNYLRPWGELDIITTKNEKVHFVEVKTVTREPGQGSGHRPEENMHPRKIQRLHRAMQTYLLGHKKLKNLDFQLDLACVYLNDVDRSAKIEIIENIVI